MLWSGETSRNIDDLATKDCGPAIHGARGRSETGDLSMTDADLNSDYPCEYGRKHTFRTAIRCGDFASRRYRILTPCEPVP